jgi:hypothetical protein
VQGVIDVLDEKWQKSLIDASAYAITMSQQLDEIANKKGIGDSLFTTDLFNKVQQLQKSMQSAFEAAGKASDIFFSQYNSRLDSLEKGRDWRRIFAADVLDIGGWLFGGSVGKFEKNNRAAAEFFKDIRQYNMESLEDINRMLADIEVAYSKTKDKLGIAYLDQAKAAAESAKKSIEELRNAIKEMVGEIGQAIQQTMLQSYREGASVVGAITKEINASLENMLANKLFNEMLAKVFDKFGDDITAAVSSGDEGQITRVYQALFDGIMAGQAGFFAQLDKAKEMAKEIGLNLFGQEAQDSVAKMEQEIESLWNTYSRLKKNASEVNMEQLEKDRDALVLKKASLAFFENSWLKTSAEELARMKKEAEALAKSIEEREGALLAGQNADSLLREIELLEMKKEAYRQTLPYIEEQIKLISDRLGGMSLSQLASGEGKALIEMRRGLEQQRDAFQRAMAGDAEEAAKTLSQLIESEKSKYELYQKWLEVYGEERAKTMLSALLSDADSYINALEAGIAEIEAKVMEGAATDDDLRQLSNRYAQRKDIYDAVAKASEEAAQKALEAWTTGFDEAVAGAEDAFDKIAAIAQKLSELDTADLSETQKDTERERLNKLLKDETKSLEKSLLKEYETIENKKLRIASEYEKQIIWLKEHGYKEEAKIAEERRSEELSGLENSQIEKTELYKDGIKQLAGMSLEEVRIFIVAMRKMVNESVHLTKEAKEAWEEAFRDWEQNALSAAEALKKEYWDGVKQGIDNVAEGISAVSELLQTLGADGEKTTKILSSLTGVAQGVASIIGGAASGNWIGVFTGSLSLLGSAYTLIRSLGNDIDRQQTALTARAKELETAYTALQRAVQKSIGTDTNRLQKESVENLSKQQAVLVQQIAAESQRKKPNQEAIAAWKAEIVNLQYEIEDILEGMTSDLLQTDVKTFARGLADAVFDAAANMKSSLQGVEDFTKKSIQNILRNYLQLQYLEAPVQELLRNLNAELLANGPSREAFEKFQKEALAVVEAFNQSFEPFREYFQEMNVDNQLKNAIAGASEQTVNAAVGLLNAMRIGQVDNLLAIQYSNELLSQSIENQGIIIDSIAAIAKDVARIRENTDWIPKIYQKINRDTMHNKGMAA